MVKSVVDYKIKSAVFEERLYETTRDNADEFTIKQLEVVVWAVAKRLQSEF